MPRRSSDTEFERSERTRSATPRLALGREDVSLIVEGLDELRRSTEAAVTDREAARTIDEHILLADRWRALSGLIQRLEQRHPDLRDERLIRNSDESRD